MFVLKMHFIFWFKSTSVFLPLTYCPPPEPPMAQVLETIYSLILDPFIENNLLNTGSSHICSNASFFQQLIWLIVWFEVSQCELFSFECFWILSNTISTYLLLQEVAVFLSLDFKYVWVCVKVCVAASVFFSIIRWNSWMCVCFFLTVRIASGVFPPFFC